MHKERIAMNSSPRFFRHALRLAALLTMTSLAGTAATAEADPDAARIFTLNSGTGVVHARVQPASVRTHDAVVVTAASASIPPPPSKIVRGTLVERPGCAVTGFEVPGGLAAMVTCDNGSGFVASPQETLTGNLVARERAGCAADGRCVVEIIADTDTAFVTNSGGSVDTAVAEIDAIVAQANARYEFDFGITFRIFRYRIRLAGEPDRYKALEAPPGDTPNIGGAILTEMQAEWGVNGWQSGNRADLVHLFLGRGWPSSGSAKREQVCGTGRVGWSRGVAGPTPERVALLIHELGHSLGADHWAGIMATTAPRNPFTAWGNHAAGEIDPIRLITSCMPANRPPSVSADVRCGGNRRCSFDGSASSDEEPLHYDWQLGDGEESAAAVGHVVYPHSGVHPVSLVVTDSVGQTRRATTTAPASIFEDVAAAHWARPWVEAIAEAGLTSGCTVSPRKFCPDSAVPRWQMSVFLLRGSRGSSYTPPPRKCPEQGGPLPTFGDVPCTHPQYAWIEDAAAKGIPVACATGMFCPDGKVTRETVAAMLLRARFGPAYAPPPRACPDDGGPLPSFSDVGCRHPQYLWIEDLAGKRIAAGCGSGRYCPTSELSRAAMSVFLATTFELPLN
jgi:hypothetical protein